MEDALVIQGSEGLMASRLGVHVLTNIKLFSSQPVEGGRSWGPMSLCSCATIAAKGYPRSQAQPKSLDFKMPDILRAQ